MKQTTKAQKYICADGNSVCERAVNQGNQENHQGERNHEVRPPALSLPTSYHSSKDWPIDREDDTKWPPRNKDGRQELEIRLGNEHISFEVGLTLRSQSSPNWL